MMHTTRYEIGQTYPLERGRDIQSGEIDGGPHWFCLIVPPQQEAKARSFLRAKDVFAFYPSVQKCRPNPGGKRDKVCWESPIVGGMVFARFEQHPQWDVLKAFRFVTGVLSIGNRPVLMGPQTMRRLQKLTYEAEEAKREAEQLAARLAEAFKPGDTAQITSPLFRGDICRVLGVFKGEADVEVQGKAIPFKVRIDTRDMEKLA